MSPTKRPSGVTSLRRAVGPGPAGQPVPAEPVPAPVQQAEPVKPARVTLNMPPELYRELDRWTIGAAEAIGVARVSVQDALRAMVRAGMRDQTAEGAVLSELRKQDSEL